MRQQRRREGAKGDPQENLIGFHQIAGPHCEESSLWRRKERWGHIRTNLNSVADLFRFLAKCYVGFHWRKLLGWEGQSTKKEKKTRSYLYCPLLTGCSTCPPTTIDTIAHQTHIVISGRCFCKFHKTLLRLLIPGQIYSLPQFTLVLQKKSQVSYKMKHVCTLYIFCCDFRSSLSFPG